MTWYTFQFIAFQKLFGLNTDRVIYFYGKPKKTILKELIKKASFYHDFKIHIQVFKSWFNLYSMSLY